MPNASIFLDGGYIDKVLSTNFPGYKLDYGKLIQRMLNGKNHDSVHYYNGIPYQSKEPTQAERDRYGNARKFFNSLNKNYQFNLRLGKVIPFGFQKDGSPKFVQKGVDSLLCADVVETVYEKPESEIILFCGDGDFVPAIEVANRKKRILTLWHGDPRGEFTRPNQGLLDLCDFTTHLDKAIMDEVGFIVG